VTAWLIAAIALLVGLVPLLWVSLRADTMSRLVALEVASVNVALVLVLLARHFERSFYSDEAIVLALLSLIGGLVFVRVLERWL
jgi:multisubunit Na+/H+ antiporter MnhF subunit